MHIRDVWAISDDRKDFAKIMAATEKDQQTILLRKAKGKRKATNQTAVEPKRARDTIRKSSRKLYWLLVLITAS
jgi:hypothetical protein